MISDNEIKNIVSKVVEKLNVKESSPEKLASKIEQSVPQEGLGAYDSVDEAIKAAKEAHLAWKALKLEKRREIIKKIRAELRLHVETLSKLAIAETGLGRVEDKINKNLLVINRTPGIEYLEPIAFSGDNGLTIVERAPFGVIGAITPCTNASETVINNGISMIAGGNAIVFNAHPSAKRCCVITCDIINNVIHKNSGPHSLFSCIVNPTIESANELMKHKGIALIVVTGGPAVVKAAMNSGKKVIAAGPGNPPVVVDETADLDRAGRSIVLGSSLDNNIVCIAEKEIFAVSKIVDSLKMFLKKYSAYELSSHQISKLEKLALTPDGHPNKSWVGKDANKFLSAIGISPKEDHRLIIVETDFNHPFVQEELLMPILPLVKVKDVHEGIELAQKAEHGFRHTACMHSKNIEYMDKMAKVMDCSIFVKNAPSYAGLGLGGEGFTSFTIASPTGEGLTTVRTFTRERRCTLAEYFRIV